jgi:hypothetical protein
MMLPFDEFVIAALMAVVVVGGTRLFYGSWPWEARKTWYCTRQAVEYVEALRGGKKRRDPAPPALPLVGDAVDTSSDSFDRGLMVYDNSPPEMMPPAQLPAVAEELAASAQKSTEKLPIVRRGLQKSGRRKQSKQVAENAVLTTGDSTALVTTGDSDSGDRATQPKQVAENAVLATGDSDSADQAAR